MKLDKRRSIQAIGLIVFGMAAILIGCHFKSINPQEDRAAFSDSFDSAVDTAKSIEESGEVKIDFDSLKAQNKDIYAWITVPGTAIDYPVLQRADAEDLYDDYYLNHTVDLVEGYPGAIYSQPVNATDFRDSVTVLYGHNMKDGSMFGCLHEFENRDFFDGNRTVIIYTPDDTLIYEIFAEVNFSDALLPYEYDFSSQDGVQMYLDDIKECEGNFNENVEVTKADKILTLSTCFSGQDANRLLIEAVLVEGK